jgi:hypothetical protein
MTAAQFRRLVLAFDGAVEGAHMGHPDFRAGNRIFASLHPDMKHGMVKVTPEQQQELMREMPDAFSPESGAWGRSGYTKVTLKHVTPETAGPPVTWAWQAATAPPSARRRSPSAARRGRTK